MDRVQEIQRIINEKFNKAAQEAMQDIIKLLAEDQKIASPLPNKQTEQLQKIRSLCRQMGADPGAVGFEALTYAVYLCWQNPRYIHNLKAMLYPEVAKKYEIQTKSVSQTLSSMVQKTVSNMREDKKESLFGDVRRQSGWSPTTGSFLGCMVEYINEKKLL